MQAVLEPDGDIVLQYQNVGDAFDLSVGTVGTENIDGSIGITLRHNGEGVAIEAGRAYLLSEHGPGNFLVWDGGSTTPSGDAQALALRQEDHTVTLLKLRLNQQLPADLRQFEAVFVNLGNFGQNGRGYHALTQAEGRILADYLNAGGRLYLEGSDFWVSDAATAVHPYFIAEGAGDGHAAAAPIIGLEGSFAEGLRFDTYEAADNDFVDHIRSLEGGQEVMSFVDRQQRAIGMVSYLGEDYRAVGASIQFGGLVDGDNGTKREFIRRLVAFFRAAPPDFPRPVNLRAVAGDGEARLSWDMPARPNGVRAEIIDIQHQIAMLIPRDGKPSLEARNQILDLRHRIADLEAGETPVRDDFLGFNIYMDGEEYDFTDARQYTAIELENGRRYVFTVSAVYQDPDGESELSDPAVVIPTSNWRPPVALDFEEFSGALTATPGQGGWEWGRPGIGAASGERAWGTGLRGGYPDLAEFELQTPPIRVPDVRRTYLEFNHFYEMEAGWDGGRIEYSIDGGDRWGVIAPSGGYPEASIFAFNEGPGYSGTSGGWIPSRVDLTQFGGSTIQIKFVFKSDDSNFRAYAGWFIDDLNLHQPESGSIAITVRNNGDGQPIPAANVRLGDLVSGTTSAQGLIFFPDVPVGDHRVTITKPGFRDFATDLRLGVDEDLATECFMQVYDSRLTLDPDEFQSELDAGDREEIRATLSNTGQDPTEFQLYIDYFTVEQRGLGPIEAERPYVGPDRDQPWDLLRTYDLTEATGDQYFISAEFIHAGTPENYLLVGGAGDFGSGDCRFYQFGRDGVVRRNVPQGHFDLNGWGVRDLCYDGNFLYGSVSDTVFRIDPINGNVIRIEFRSPLEVTRAMAYVPGEDVFWIGDRDDSWYKVSRAGQVLDRVPNHGLTGVVGMAWNPSDPDGAFLYVHNQETPEGGAAIYRFNPNTRQLVRQLVTAQVQEGFAGGAFTTYLYDTQTWMLGVVIQGPEHDILKLYELWPAQNWLSVTPQRGALQSGAQTQLTVSIDTRRLVDTDTAATIVLHDLRLGTFENFLAALNVIGGLGSLEGELSLDVDSTVVASEIWLNRQMTQPEDEEGFFQFLELLPGRYQLRAYRDGFEPFISDSFDIASNQNVVRDIQLNHIQMGTISGRVRAVYRADSVMVGAEVTAQSQGDDRLFFTDTTDAAGEFSLRLNTGIYRLSVHLPAWRTQAVADIEIEDGGEFEHEFVLDDRLPVRSLVADTLHDNKLVLSWLPPGMVALPRTIRYDNDTLANAVYLRGRRDVIAVRFEPEGTFDILTLVMRIIRRGDLGFANGWPDRNPQPVYMAVYAEDPETGLPGEVLWTDFVDGHIRNPGWVTVRPRNLRFMSEPFYIGWHQNINPPANEEFLFDAVGLDRSMDHEGVTAIMIDDQWRRFDDFPGDLLLYTTIWSYEEDEEQELAPGRRIEPRREVEAYTGSVEGLELISGTPSYENSLLNQFGVSIPDNPVMPLRDPPANYLVFKDDTLVATVFQSSWEDTGGTNGENIPHRYMVSSVYGDEDSTEVEGVEIVARYNNPPAAIPSNSVRVVNTGLNYTISWLQPDWNRDGTRCHDYAGCQVFLNGQLMASVLSPQVQYRGRLDEGAEGWYDLRLVAYDEIPNRSVAYTQRIALGVNQVYSFETITPVFSVTPVGSWVRDNRLARGPGAAHSPTYVWGTRPFVGQYDNDADWTMTTLSEFSITSPNARVEFYQFMSAEAGKDGGQLLISVDGGAWSLLTPVGGYPDQTVAAFGNGPAWTGEIDAWTLVSVDLSEYQGHLVKFRWRFRSDASINWYPGWYIDDLVIWGGSPPIFAQIYGTIRDQDGQAVTGATISSGRASTTSGQGGIFRLQGIMPGEAVINASKAGYPPSSTAMFLRERDSLRVDLEIYRPILELLPGEEEWQYELGGNERVSTLLTIRNLGEVAVPYNLRLLSQEPDRDQGNRRHLRSISSSLPERDRPGDVQFDWNATGATGLRRIMGVEYAGDRFYLSAADPTFGNMVAILSHDGQLLGRFPQPLARPVGWGLRDLAWDGTLLYGSQNDTIYGFNTAGQLQSTQLGAPLTVNRALAYDAATDAFWCGEWDSPWYLVNRQGEVVTMWDQHGLTGVYGFAVHSAGPDRLPLYVANLEVDGSTRIYRANPEEGRIEEVFDLDGPPTGFCITGTWDASRWIAATIHGSPTQLLTGIELGPRSNWITFSPIDGLIEPGEENEIEVVIAVPPGAQEGDQYSGQLTVHAFGGSVAAMNAGLEITEGFRHFDPPVESDAFMDINISSALIEDHQPPIGSEIAVLSPRGRVGGVVRWIQNAADLRLYAGNEAMAAGDSLAFRIWDAGSDVELIPTVEFIQGETRFIVDAVSEVHLTYREGGRHSVQLERGWNLISSYIHPNNIDIPTMFAGILQRGHLLLVKDGSGRFWTPRFGFNGLLPWSELNGYMVNVSSDDSLVVRGDPVDPATAIPLDVGWNTVGYLLDHSVGSEVGFEDIIDAMIIAKNGRGEFMAPRFGFIGLRELRPGEGYKLKVDRRLDLIYHDQPPGAQLALSPSPVEFGRLTPSTGYDMSVLIQAAPDAAIGPNVELLARSLLDGRIVGRSVIDALPAGLIVRGDDSTTVAIEGARRGEAIEITAVRAGITVATLDAGHGSIVYRDDDFLVTRITAPVEPLPLEFTVCDAYPNPFNSTSIARFGLSEASDVSAELVDVTGRVVWNSSQPNLAAGWHSYQIDASALSTGVYYLRLHAQGKNATTKLVLMR
jgi:hypothetical protein